MGWESKVAYQMLSCFCLLRTTSTPSWMAPLALLLLFATYQLVGFGFLSILFTSVAVLLSTVLYTWKHKAVPVDELVEENVLTSEGKSSHQRENIAPTPMLMNESMIEAKERQEEQVSDGVTVANDSDPSPDKLSESACQDQLSTSEDSDSDLDGSISDEDSLIEIALPSGHFVGQQKEECKYNCSLQQNKRRELSAESLFNQQNLMDFLAEFNEMYEEENLIEIDISMGSIKYSRFEIEA